MTPAEQLEVRLLRAHRRREGLYVPQEWTGDQNVRMWRIGEAWAKAHIASVGDPIDRGLTLVKELEAKGFVLVQVTR
jgi:hypothetical protein